VPRKKKEPPRGRETASSTPPPLPDRRLMERTLARIGRLLESQEFASVEEANAYLEQIMAAGEPPAAEPVTPLEQAQEIVYEALEATGRRRTALARKALAVSPDCADAYVILAEQSRDPQEARRLYEEGVRAGERALGPSVFEHEVGHFWSIIETRPYMRARAGLAEVLWYLDERDAAIAHLTDLLRLNPGDNQGVRYTLANWLLIAERLAELEHLLATYPDDYSATWAYTRALLAFRKDGPGPETVARLHAAFETNPFVPLYLLGAKRLPRQLPAYIGIGDENEAVAYVADSAEAWVRIPGALEWLIGVVTRELDRTEPPGGAL
jgi:tetratricopeptide (TPR) repeat protein